MKIYTYHAHSARKIGGIEAFYRSIHRLGTILGADNYNLYSEEIKDEDCDFELLDVKEILIKKRDFKYDPANIFYLSLRVLYFLLKNRIEKNDVLICVDPRILVAIPDCFLKRIKVIIVQCNRFDQIYNRFSTMIVKRKWSYIDYFTVYTSTDKKTLSELFPFIFDKIEIIPRACRIDKANSPVLNNKCSVTVARLSPEKNIESMIDIFNILPHDYTLDIYGDGDFYYVERLKSRVKNKNKIRFLGVKTDLEKILPKYGIFLMTSKYEGYGQTLIEARSQGLPIIAFNTFDALKHIVIDDYNGYKITPFDKSEFSEKILKVFSSNKLHHEFSSNSLKMSDITTNETINKKWIDILSN